MFSVSSTNVPRSRLELLSLQSISRGSAFQVCERRVSISGALTFRGERCQIYEAHEEQAWTSRFGFVTERNITANILLDRLLTVMIPYRIDATSSPLQNGSLTVILSKCAAAVSLPLDLRIRKAHLLFAMLRTARLHSTIPRLLGELLQ